MTDSMLFLQEFHARPAPRKIFEGPVGIPERRQLALVEPQSPAFALKDRLANRKRPAPTGEAEEAEEERPFRARPVPHFGVPVIMKVLLAECCAFFSVNSLGNPIVWSNSQH